MVIFLVATLIDIRIMV